MKKQCCLMIFITVLCMLTACGGQKAAETAGGSQTAAGAAEAAGAVTGWTRQGYFQDENENTMWILPSEDEEHPGWSVGCMLGEDLHGWYIQQEGDTLHGTIVPDYEEGEFIVTVSEEGEDGVQLAVDGGETYHFAPMDMPEATIFVSVNVEGNGCIAYTEGEETPEVDKEYPFQSAQINLAEPAVHTILAWPKPGWKFVKWTKDGEDFSTEAQVTLELAETADYIAVFEEDEDYVSPYAGLEGSYVCDRARADVSFSEETAFVVVEWADSAAEGTRWDLIGEVDPETLTMHYDSGLMRKLTYNSDGDIEDETREYEDGTGTITFTKEGPGFTWHDDKSDREDMVFAFMPADE